MTELLSSLEEIEPALRDSTKRARGKLQKEWTNFKEGYICFCIKLNNIIYIHYISTNLIWELTVIILKDRKIYICLMNGFAQSFIFNIPRLKSSFCLKPLELATICI